MVKVKKETVRSDTSKKAAPAKNKLKTLRQREYTKYLRSRQFKEVKDIVYARQGGICPICGELIDDSNPGSCHHRSYKYAGMGGEIEANDCVFIHRDEHRELHRSKLSFQKYSVLNDRNDPVEDNHSDLAEAIRRERAAHKKKNKKDEEVIDSYRIDFDVV